jgi:hypothetical protein
MKEEIAIEVMVMMLMSLVVLVVVEVFVVGDSNSIKVIIKKAWL